MVDSFKKTYDVTAHPDKSGLAVQISLNIAVQDLSFCLQSGYPLQIVIEGRHLIVQVALKTFLEHELRLVENIEELVDIDYGGVYFTKKHIFTKFASAVHVC